MSTAPLSTQHSALSTSLPLAHRQGERVRLAAAHQPQFLGGAGAVRTELREQVVRIAQRLASEANQNIANQQAAAIGRPVLLDAQHQEAAVLAEAVLVHQRRRQRHGLRADAQKAALYAAALQ